MERNGKSAFRNLFASENTYIKKLIPRWTSSRVLKGSFNNVGMQFCNIVEVATEIWRDLNAVATGFASCRIVWYFARQNRRYKLNEFPSIPDELNSKYGFRHKFRFLEVIRNLLSYFVPAWQQFTGRLLNFANYVERVRTEFPIYKFRWNCGEGKFIIFFTRTLEVEHRYCFREN